MPFQSIWIRRAEINAVRSDRISMFSSLTSMHDELIALGCRRNEQAATDFDCGMRGTSAIDLDSNRVTFGQEVKNSNGGTQTSA